MLFKRYNYVQLSAKMRLSCMNILVCILTLVLVEGRYIGDSGDVQNMFTNTGKFAKTCPCNIQRFLVEKKNENFIRKNLTFFLFLLKTEILGTR